jgi:multidrug efflux pump subunit AcrB
VKSGRGFIRHYNLRRTITVEANLDKTLTDTPDANADHRQAGWEKIRAAHPECQPRFLGRAGGHRGKPRCDEVLFLLGMGLIYLILAAQFASYWQPLMILVTVPLAFTGVASGWRCRATRCRCTRSTASSR